MAKEVLAVPEDYLLDVIEIIRLGMKSKGEGINEKVKYNLEKWCTEEEAYINGLNEED